jgi:hypothetical protein
VNHSGDSEDVCVDQDSLALKKNNSGEASGDELTMKRLPQKRTVWLVKVGSQKKVRRSF